MNKRCCRDTRENKKIANVNVFYKMKVIREAKPIKP